VNFAENNLAYTTQNCQNFALWHVKDGGTYSFSVQGTGAGTCDFDAFSDGGTTALTVKMPPDHGAVTPGTMTVYSFMVMGSVVFVTWIPGF
jgi:hypothetical protein